MREAKELTVFIVDDDHASASSTAALVMSIGIRNEVFDSAESFLDAYRGQTGCVVVDVRLPGMNGLELQQALIHNGYDVPVILMSGHADSKVAEIAIRNRAVAMLQKPFSGDALCDAIRQSLARKSE